METHFWRSGRTTRSLGDVRLIHPAACYCPSLHAVSTLVRGIIVRRKVNLTLRTTGDVEPDINGKVLLKSLASKMASSASWGKSYSLVSDSDGHGGWMSED